MGRQDSFVAQSVSPLEGSPRSAASCIPDFQGSREKRSLSQGEFGSPRSRSSLFGRTWNQILSFQLDPRPSPPVTAKSSHPPAPNSPPIPPPPRSPPNFP